MDRATIKPETPESLMTDEIIHNVAGTDLTISALYYSGTNGEGVTQLKLEGQLNSAELGRNDEIQEERLGYGLIKQSSGTISDLVVTGPQDVQTNRRPSASDNQEDVKANISAPDVKQEIIDTDVKQDGTGDVIKKEIYKNQITGEEILGSNKYIKLEDGMNCPFVDNLEEIVKIELVKAEEQPVVIKNELTEFERVNDHCSHSDDEMSLRIQKTSILPGIVILPSCDEGNDGNLTSGKEFDHEEEKIKGLMSNHQLYKNKRQERVEGLKDAEEHVPSKDDSQEVNSSQNAEKPHQCKMCGEYYKTFWCLKNHLRLHTDQRPYSCKYCDKRFSQITHYKAHLLRHKNKNNKCTKCDKTFIHMSELFIHEKCHLKSEDYRCSICQESFTQPSALYTHRKIHCVKPYLCLYAGCGKEFKHVQQLQVHERSHSDVMPNVGKISNESFVCPGDLHDQVKTKPDVKTYGCPQCDKHFKLSQHLRNHMLTHSTDVQFKCPECDKEFLQQKHLKRHVLIHSVEKSRICHLCEVGFNSSEDLRRHQRVHTGDKPYKCPDCGKFFSRLCHLKTHKLLHTGKRLFVCETCNTAFAQPDGLRRHEITHQDVKPYSCADCGKTFSQLSNMKAHQLLHTGKKLYACEICDKSFSQPSGRHQHMQTHKVKSLSCAHCGKSFSRLRTLKTHQLLCTT